MSSSPFPYCFRRSPTTDDNRDSPQPPPPPPHSTNPNLTTYLYQTNVGLVSLTWSRSILGRSLHLEFHNHPFDSPPQLNPSSSSSFHLHIKPFVFWKKHGTKKLSSNTQLFWNLSKSKFGSGPEPISGFYFAVVVDNVMTLLVGDSNKDVYSKSKLKVKDSKNFQYLVMKREHVYANKVYNTSARFGGKTREIQIDCGGKDHSKLCFSVDGEKVLQIKRLKWKFRGNERVEIDGVNVQISWDVFNWLFVKDNDEKHATFMFKFEEDEEDRSLMNLWNQNQQQNLNLGVDELGKFGKSFSSSVSMASSGGSFGASSSVLDWSSVEENELVVHVGFSLLVYAWKR